MELPTADTIRGDVPQPPGAAGATNISRLIKGFTRRRDSGIPAGLTPPPDAYDMAAGYMDGADDEEDGDGDDDTGAGAGVHAAGGGQRGYRQKLQRKKHTFRWLLFLHGKAAKKSEWWHYMLMILVILIALVGAILPEFLGEFHFWECTWSLVMNQGFSGVIVALTAFKDNFGFEKNAERHEEVRREYGKLADMIDGALMRAKEMPEEEIDLSIVYDEVQAAYDNLARGGRIDLPRSLEKAYEDKLYPWLAHQRAAEAARGEEAQGGPPSILQRLRGLSSATVVVGSSPTAESHDSSPSPSPSPTDDDENSY